MPDTLKQQISMMLEQMPRIRIGWRDRAITLLLTFGGMYAKEISSLKMEVIVFEQDFAKIILRNVHGKRIVFDVRREPDPDYCPVHALERWLHGLLFSGGRRCASTSPTCCTTSRIIF